MKYLPLQEKKATAWEASERILRKGVKYKDISTKKSLSEKEKKMGTKRKGEKIHLARWYLPFNEALPREGTIEGATARGHLSEKKDKKTI